MLDFDNVGQTRVDSGRARGSCLENILHEVIIHIDNFLSTLLNSGLVAVWISERTDPKCPVAGESCILILGHWLRSSQVSGYEIHDVTVTLSVIALGMDMDIAQSLK